MDYGFGRLYSPDERDKRFPMRLALDPLRQKYFPHGFPDGGTRHYRMGPVLDQRATGTCVAHGWIGRILAGPVMQSVLLSPYDLYRRIVVNDEFPENDFEATAPDAELQGGTSVRAGAKVLQDLGYVTQYLWARDVADLRGWHLAGFGGVVMGVSWHTGMMEPDADGYISATGGVEGGHCVVSSGWDDCAKHRGKPVRAMRIRNSWGTSWGQRGNCWIEETELAKLCQDRGEFCAPVEHRL